MCCPYCSSEMTPYMSVEYFSPDKVRVADWARCTGCGHVTVVSVRVEREGRGDSRQSASAPAWA